jgi:acyl-CoA synthetase (AMP-forming)/AMP-acid ligase II
MPKGVMWRAEDVFFGAIGGGDPGDPIASPEAITDHFDLHRRGLPACPFVHGTAHWTAFSTFYSGGTVVIAPDRRFDAEQLWPVIAGERVTFLVIVGDAFARPLVEAFDRLDPAPDVSALTVVLSGDAVLSPAVKAAWLDRFPGTLLVDSFGASETGGQGRNLSAAGGAVEGAMRFHVDEETAVLGDDLRPVPDGEVGKLARRGRVPLGYYRDPEARRPRSRWSTGCGGRCPATTRASSPTARSRSSVAAPCASTPAARRSTRRRWSRR